MNIRWRPLAYAAACILSAGCSTHDNTIAPETAAAPSGAGVISYTFALQPGAPPRVRVTLRVTGEADGSSRLAIAPDWGGVENCERFVHDLAVHDAAGHACGVVSDAAAPHGWNVSHEPGAALVASYELRPSPTDPLAAFGTHYEPVVRPEFFQLIGQTGLIYPEWLEDAPAHEVDIRCTWEGFRESGWTVVSSFDGTAGARGRTLPDFRHAMFLAAAPGSVRVQDRDIPGGKLRVAIVEDDWGFNDTELIDLVARIVTVEREFVGDFEDPYFLVTVAPTGPRATPQSISMGGTGLTNCFALFMAPGTTVAPESAHRRAVLHLLAHEYFHTWNGGKITTADPEELVYWFSEGFTDFYAARLLHRAGLVSSAEWLDRTNETLRNLWLSPVATAPAETIRREFWSRREVQQLPYNRGEVVALMLDEEIRRVSGGRQSLDDFFRELLREARGGEKAQTDSLLARVERWTSRGFAADLRDIVVDGVLPSPPARTSDPAAVRIDADTYRYDPGFDVDTSLQTRIASGVREGSAAYAAGLRDGQALVGFSVHHGNPDRQIELKIKEGEQPRSVVYFPRGEPIRMPRYQPNDAPDGAAHQPTPRR